MDTTKQAAHVVIYSGGMDSFTLLHSVIRNVREFEFEGGEVYALSFDYGQRHSKELEMAREETTRLGIIHQVIDLRSVLPLLQGSALTTPDIAVPEGHYAEESMKKTVVPGRNTIMLALGMAYAESLVMRGLAAHAYVFYGAHSGDHAIYPDCRPAFIGYMENAMMVGTNSLVHLRAPFMHLDKAAILREGAVLGLTAADYARTWTCYKGGEHACGVCGSCNEREEAFRELGWADPALGYFYAHHPDINATVDIAEGRAAAQAASVLVSGLSQDGHEVG